MGWIGPELMVAVSMCREKHFNYMILRIFNTVTYNSGKCKLEQIDGFKAVIKVDECPLHFDKPEMCLAHTTMEQTVVEELNPDLTYRIGKSIPAGDHCCEHIIEIKK